MKTQLAVPDIHLRNIALKETKQTVILLTAKHGGKNNPNKINNNEKMPRICPVCYDNSICLTAFSWGNCG